MVPTANVPCLSFAFIVLGIAGFLPLQAARAEEALEQPAFWRLADAAVSALSDATPQHYGRHAELHALFQTQVVKKDKHLSISKSIFWFTTGAVFAFLLVALLAIPSFRNIKEEAKTGETQGLVAQKAVATPEEPDCAS
jgi:hypothetical protein